MKHFRIIRKPNFDGIEPDKIIPNQDINQAVTISGLTNTDQLPEGLTNLYYHDYLVDARITLFATTASNLGTPSSVIPGLGIGLFANKVGVDLQFKSLLPGSNKILINSDSNNVTIDVSEGNLTLNNISGTLSVSKGGTGLTTYNPGDLIYVSALNVLSALPTDPIDGKVLTSVGGFPSWEINVVGVSNIGGGSEWYKDLNIDTFEFRTAVAASTKITILQNADTISFDVSESNLTLDNIGGILSTNKGGTGISSYSIGDLLYANSPTTLDKRGIGSPGDILTVSGSNLPVWAPLSSIADPYVPMWVKYTVSYAALSNASLTNDIELFELPPSGFIHAIKIKHSVQFTGGGVSTYKVDVGIIGELDRYVSSFECTDLVDDETFLISNTFQSENHGSPTSVRVSTLSDVNLDTITGGSVDIWLLLSKTPF